jgi:hypothetical protein
VIEGSAASRVRFVLHVLADANTFTAWRHTG